MMRIVLNRVFFTAIAAAVAVPCSITAQQASIVGVVLRDSSETPLANAEILLTGTNRSVRTDSAGAFAFRDLKPGRHSITIRLVGYESLSTDFSLAAGQVIEPEVILRKTVTTLNKVDVKAAATTGPWAIKLQDFDERRKAGIGKFLTADYFESARGAPLSSLMRDKISGLKFVMSAGRYFAASTRVCGSVNGSLPCPGSAATMEKVPSGQCYMQIYINGIARYRGMGPEPMFDMDQLNSLDVLGIEFYTVANTPVQYKGTSPSANCGTIIIWTKGG